MQAASIGVGRRASLVGSCLRRVAGILLLLVGVHSVAAAQIIRGVVTERGSGVPLAGALITLTAAEPAADSGAPRSTVTNERGEYVLRVHGAGRYRLTARRIGVQAYVSGVLSIESLDVLVHDVVLDPFTTLPRVTVADRTLCTTGRDGLRVAALWREAQTALTVIIASGQDSALTRRLVRFTRRLAPITLEITSEEAHSFDEYDGIGEPLFRSQTGDSLSRGGYWQDAPGAMTFFGPDAHALLSRAFLRDHCFSIAEGRAGRAGLVGLAFTPVRGRLTPDIRGTLWMDATSYELKLAEFEWTQLPRELQHARIGGEVQFMRLPTGSWIVKHWTLTMPRPAIRELRMLGGVTREQLMSDGLGQEGGMIIVQGLEQYDRPGTVTGTIVRSGGQPLAGARLRLVGTPFRTAADPMGRFRFDSVPPGLHVIVAEHGDFDAFGVRAAEQEFVLEEGATRNLAFVTPGERAIADAMCPGRDFHLPTLRVTLINEETRRPLANVALRLRWFDVVPVQHGDLLGRETRDVDANATTDANGNAVFCSVAASKTLTLGYPVGTGLYPLHTFKLGPQENAVATIRAAPPD